MGVGLQPLEFTDCLTDSPYFRENLHAHEKELEKTSQQIKRLIKEVKDLLSAAKNLSRAQRTLSNSLKNFSFDCIGTSQTDDEVVISKSLAQFGQLIASIEDERDRMLERAYDQIIVPLDTFRKVHIGGVKEGKKKFDKQTAKFCQSQERYLNLSTKKQDAVLQEADATLQLEQRYFCQASLEYVFVLQEAQERKKFEFVETLLSFMFSWLTFYHQGHEVAEDFKPYMRELQIRIQKTRENFEETRDKTESLMKKMLEMRQTKPVEAGITNKQYTREGYLFMMEKKAFGTTAWSKQYCMYQRDKKEFIMIPYNQMTGKFNSSEKMILASCVRRMSDSIDKRFCFDVTSVDKPGVIYTLQALSEEDRKSWMDVMDGKEPVSEEPHHAMTYTQPGKVVKERVEERVLDEVGFMFVNKCIEALESRGLEEQGLYRVVGITSKVTKLLSLGLDRRKLEKLNLDDAFEWESKTITSALKTYLRNLPEPLTTFRYHNGFIAAAKQETHQMRVNDVHVLMHRLPQTNFNMLDILIHHLTNVSAKSDKNLMSVSNLGVCFGPTLLRPEEETVAAIMDIKFCNVVVEILIENYEKIFKSEPENLDSIPTDTRPEVRNDLRSDARLDTRSDTRPDMRPDSRPDARTYVKAEPTYISTTPPHSLTHAIIRGPHHVSPGQHHVASKMHYESAVRGDLGSSLSSSMHNVASAVRETESVVHRYHMGVEHMSREHAVPTQTSPQQAQPQQPAQQRHMVRLMGPTSRATAYSEGNLLTLQQQQQQHQMQKAKAQPFYGTQVNASRADALNSTSSSNESVSSLSSRDINVHSSYAAPTPQKSKRGAVGKMDYHFATSYQPQETFRRVRTLYACLGENDGELSFEPNQIITNVRSSLEPGWLEGTLNGKSGLVPENYVEVLP